MCGIFNWRNARQSREIQLVTKMLEIELTQQLFLFWNVWHCYKSCKCYGIFFIYLHSCYKRFLQIFSLGCHFFHCPILTPLWSSQDFKFAHFYCNMFWVLFSSTGKKHSAPFYGVVFFYLIHHTDLHATFIHIESTFYIGK